MLDPIIKVDRLALVQTQCRGCRWRSEWLSGHLAGLAYLVHPCTVPAGIALTPARQPGPTEADHGDQLEMWADDGR